MGAWGTIFNVFFAHGFVRIPLFVLTPGILYGKYALLRSEDFINYMNAGHTQKDIWERLEKKVKAMEEAEAA
jgi:hypothetical protein